METDERGEQVLPHLNPEERHKVQVEHHPPRFLLPVMPGHHGRQWGVPGRNRHRAPESHTGEPQHGGDQGDELHRHVAHLMQPAEALPHDHTQHHMDCLLPNATHRAVFLSPPRSSFLGVPCYV